MIGSAEIEEMMAEFAEKVGGTDAGASADAYRWPLFVAAEHLDEADRQLVESPQHWVHAALRLA